MIDAPTAPAPYPVTFDVDYPERQSRWKALFRIPLAIPALIFAGLALYASFLALLVMWLAVLVRGRIPRWLFDFLVGVYRFNARVNAYVALLTDVYPAFDGDYPVRYDVTYPERTSRWKLAFWKIASSIPQWIAVTVLQYASFALVAVGWLVILLTGTFPKGLHQFVVGVSRWRERVYAYTLSLTDEYPPYSMSADAPAASGAARTASSVVGATALVVLVVGGITGVAVFVTQGGQDFTREVSYEQLLARRVPLSDATADIHSGSMRLLYVDDPVADRYGFLRPSSDSRLVEFGLSVLNWRGAGETVPIRASAFTLKDSEGSESEALLAVSDGVVAPVNIVSGDLDQVVLVFEVSQDADPTELRWDVINYIDYPRVGETITWVFH